MADIKHGNGDGREWLYDADSLRVHAQSLGLDKLETHDPGLLKSTAMATARYLAILDAHPSHLGEPHLVPQPKDTP